MKTLPAYPRSINPGDNRLEANGTPRLTIPCKWRAYADWMAPTVVHTGRWPSLAPF